MKLSLCTISFRHHLISLEELAVWAAETGFDGIELWGAHARNLAHDPRRNGAWLADFGLSVPMVSDYLPLDGEVATLLAKTRDLCRLAQVWQAKKIRSFAGTTASAATAPAHVALLVERLRLVCAVAAEHGLSLLIETHPNTLADTLAGTQSLIAAVDHPALKINFDVLHVWEGGDDVLAARQALAPHIAHYHLKNIRSRADLAVFEPGNVYAAAGLRDGMVPLFEGVVDYTGFLPTCGAAEASLEWFGASAFEVLRSDRLAVCACVGNGLRVARQPSPPALALRARH
ncbi:3-dehydroshikimate dehydratase [Elstera litoralis]|uniref:3-dehydroshikimate dehydratase n=1 Tax=Elstera litoralis TaxID=552518 RepID=A0A0F3IV39_9PROT|nr:sugar phosphate isomerase/epimerase [Elstera litoralis]KJV10551.1 3-dehydroshikimate dehydratase [Elstera litoralis]